ncbi:hypothetical protein FACS1894191_0280 [Clostridia bacterium]|nr:hypothetical protein FACS1894191_0280 [Clostridia bacterium]
MLMKKKVIAGASAAALAGIIGLAAILSGFTSGGGKTPAAVQVRAAALQKGDLAVSISATGTVYSAEATNVYSNLNYPVKAVYVSVGDAVSEGDVLAELDTAALKSDIAQKQASIDSSQANALQNLATAKRDLEAYRRNSEEGYDSSLLSAEAAVKTAEMDVHTAELDVQSSELDVEAANRDLHTARQNYRDAQNDEGSYEYNSPTESQLDALRDTVSAKETSLEKSQTSLEKIKGNLEKAKANLEKAKTSYEAAKVSNADSLSSYQAKVKSAELSADVSDQLLSIQKLEEDMAKAVITAPVSGTVTSVSAIAGASGSGLLFVIQNTDNLKVVTNIKEYDIEAVSVGDRVTIETDATGETKFTGKLSRIAPTSTLTATGGTASSTDAEFEAEVSVSSSQKGLRIGMNTRMSIITEEKKDVYFVPFEAVAKRGEEAIVYAARPGEGETFTAEAIPVTVGLENDLYIEISGDALFDGMLIVSDSEGISPGDALTVRGSGLTGGTPAGAGAERAAGMPGGFPGGGVRVAGGAAPRG